MFLPGIETIRSVEWSKAFLWDIRFVPGKDKDGNPDKSLAPFDKWFPAIDVEENLWTLESMQVDTFIGTFKIPRATSSFDLRVTFMDDMKRTVQQWMTSWVNNTILRRNTSIARVEDPGVARMIQIAKLDSYHQPIESPKSYLVYPEGAHYWHGTSQSEVEQYQVNFIIVG